MTRTLLFAAALTALLVGVAPAAQPAIPRYIAKAVADPKRPDTDRARDAERKPAECLAFAGVKPGEQGALLAHNLGTVLHFRYFRYIRLFRM